MKGLSPEIANMGRTTLSFMAEVKMDTLKRRLEVEASPGSETLACMTQGVRGNLGGPAGHPFPKRRVCLTTERREEGKRGRRASDRLIVLEKAGNAAGGKEATVGGAE